MKKRIHKCGRLLRSNKGETIMESIISLLVLSILLLAVMTMIKTAMSMTSVLTRDAGEMQEAAMNPVIWANHDDDANYSISTNASITFSASRVSDSATVIFTATHPIEFNETGGVVAFSPPKD